MHIYIVHKKAVSREKAAFCRRRSQLHEFDVSEGENGAPINLSGHASRKGGKEKREGLSPYTLQKNCCTHCLYDRNGALKKRRSGGKYSRYLFFLFLFLSGQQHQVFFCCHLLLLFWPAHTHTQYKSFSYSLDAKWVGNAAILLLLLLSLPLSLLFWGLLARWKETRRSFLFAQNRFVTHRGFKVVFVLCCPNVVLVLINSFR